MAGVIVTNVPQGISVCEQKCYLQYEGDNQAIMDCLDDAVTHQVIGSGIVILIFIILCALFVWFMER